MNGYPGGPNQTTPTNNAVAPAHTYRDGEQAEGRGAVYFPNLTKQMAERDGSRRRNGHGRESLTDRHA